MLKIKIQGCKVKKKEEISAMENKKGKTNENRSLDNFDI